MVGPAARGCGCDRAADAPGLRTVPRTPLRRNYLLGFHFSANAIKFYFTGKVAGVTAWLCSWDLWSDVLGASFAQAAGLREVFPCS